MTYIVHRSKQENFEDAPAAAKDKEIQDKNDAANTFFGILSKIE